MSSKSTPEPVPASVPNSVPTLDAQDAASPLGTDAAAPDAITADPQSLKLETRANGRLWLIRAGHDDVAVRVVRPFPWTAPTEYLSLINDDDHEEALVRAVDELDPDSQVATLEALAPMAFVLEIEAVEHIETEFEIRLWTVRTKQGRYRFQIKHDDWPHPLAAGGFILRDIDANLFRIPPLEQLDETSRKLLWAYTD